MLRGLQNTTSGFGHEERKLVLQPGDPPRSVASLDSKPSLHNKSTSVSARYSGLPDGAPGHTSHHSVSGGSFAPVKHTGLTSQLPLPGPNALAALPLKTPADELRALLPQAKHVMKYADIYTQSSHTLFPVDIGIPHVAELSFQYISLSLGERVVSSLESRNVEAFRSDAISIALLCAAIAAGVQVSDLEELSRKQLLRQYIASAMKLLRMADAQANTSIAAYPVLLIVSRVVQDEFDPILSYSMLGSLQRTAHVYSITTVFTDRLPEETRHLRTLDSLMRVRHRQEAFLALILGQSHLLERPPYPEVRGWTNAGYVQCLDVLAGVATYCATENIDREDLLLGHADAMQSIQPLERWTAPHLADKSQCRNNQELLEFRTLRIHECLVNMHYCQVIMAACRRLPGHEEEYFKTSDICRNKARDGIDTYLEMLTFNIVPLRNWILTITTLRAALVLAVLLAETPATVAEVAPDKERLTKIWQAFNTVQHDETGVDRLRWSRRYRLIFERLGEMCEALGRSYVGQHATNGTTSNGPEHGTALRYMSREDRDNIIMPQRMVQHYLAVPTTEDSTPGSLLLSQQSIFEI